MNPDPLRRRILEAGLAGGALALLPSAIAQAAMITATPAQTAGPFYPEELPLDDDSDLVVVRGSKQLAKGEITHLTGDVVDSYGKPVSYARVEIWQCDANGRYHHPRDRGSSATDPNFQGHGSYQTGKDGRFRFRTIRPVPYPGRTPHIHFAIQGPGFEPLVTQMYVAGEPLNERDFILNSIRDPALRESLIVPLKKEKAAQVWSGHFRVVLAADGRYQST